ncbi:hypothetical protein BM527_13825 [Alteromonas sp. Mex14]|nr:hypothetical protein BM527_13825 [Alteromonas sp. Mex14]
MSTMNENGLLEYIRFQSLTAEKKVKSRYSEYKDKAVTLCNNHDEVDKLICSDKYFRKALRFASKNQYAIASVYHDLGVLYFTHFSRLPNGPVSNLTKAVQFFNRAIKKPERKKFPEKYASSLSQLAATYRRAAMEPLWHQSPIECLEQAEKLHKKALKILHESSWLPEFIRFEQSSIIHFNLASVLFDAGQISEACIEQAEAFSCYMRAIEIAPSQLFVERITLKPTQLFAITFSRLNYFSKSSDHQALCNYIGEISPLFGIDPLYFLNVNPMGDISNPLVEIRHLVQQALAGKSSDSESKLRKKLSQLMKVRQTAQSDQEADRLAVLIQQTASGLARVLSINNNGLSAFAELENVSAMRFCESASSHWLMPSDNLASYLLNIQRQLGSVFYGLNELSLLYRNEEVDKVREVLKESAILLNHNNENSLDNDIPYLFDVKQYASILDVASSCSDPISLLIDTADKCLEDFKKLGSVIDKLDPEYYNERMRTYDIRERDIDLALRTHPDLALIKIDVEDYYEDALVLVAYLENNKAKVDTFSFKLPEQLINQIGEAVTKTSNVKSDWSLDFIDWKKVIPKNHTKVALLPSFFASHIPWLATGNKGSLLIDLVTEVSWLPSVMYLYMQSNYSQSKHGSYKMLGGNTLFESLVNTEQQHFEISICKHELIKRIKEASVVSYYGHCEHNYPNRPTLLFEDKQVIDFELRTAVRGASRIEFWACQSGSNIPLHLLASNVNEAFGMDMRMLEWGAKTAIGTLWAVPELVTAHIKTFYQSLVDKGVSASEALLSAQRWWVNCGADEVIEAIKLDGKESYLRSIGYKSVGDDFAELTMGPVLSSNEEPSSENLEDLSATLKHPSSWAGIRFCGVDEVKNVFIEQKELNENEHLEVAQMISELSLESEFIHE